MTSVEEFARRYPISPARQRELDEGKRRLEVEVARMKAADLRRAQERDRMIDPDYTPAEFLPATPIRGIGEKIAVALERFRDRVEAARASFEGDCFRCHDAGPCAFCGRGLAEIARIQREARAQAVVSWSTRACVPRDGDSWGFDTFPVLTDAHRAVQAFVERWDSREWLLLHGNYGTGKTGLMIAALHALAPSMIERGLSARFVSVTDLYESFRAAYDGAPMPDYRKPDLLIIDDLGAARQTEWATEQLFAIINGRLSDRRATWVTTNLEPAALPGVITPRIYWRLYERCHMVEVAGPNLRTV